LSDPEGQQTLIEHLRVAFLGEGEEFFQILGTEAVSQGRGLKPGKDFSGQRMKKLPAFS